MEDKVLLCQDCCCHFIFTVKLQQKYAENGWADPIRCPNCREKKRERAVSGAYYRSLMYGGPMRLYSRHGRGFFKKLGR